MAHNIILGYFKIGQLPLPHFKILLPSKQTFTAFNQSYNRSNLRTFACFQALYLLNEANLKNSESGKLLLNLKRRGRTLPYPRNQEGIIANKHLHPSWKPHHVVAFAQGSQVKVLYGAQVQVLHCPARPPLAVALGYTRELEASWYWQAGNFETYQRDQNAQRVAIGSFDWAQKLKSKQPKSERASLPKTEPNRP